LFTPGVIEIKAKTATRKIQSAKAIHQSGGARKSRAGSGVHRSLLSPAQLFWSIEYQDVLT
jgi:hypothetical protein